MSSNLHSAVLARDAERVATLLHNGADWRVPDPQGRRALDPADLQFLHRVRQAYHRLAEAPFDDRSRASEQARAWVETLERDGIVKVEGLVAPGLLARMQRDFARFIRRLGVARRFRLARYRHYDARAYWHPRDRAYVDNDCVARCEALLEVCSDPRLIEAASFYLRKAAHLRRVTGMRYPPSDAIDGRNQFGWHHDMEDRQFKVMVLLTDIGEHDQYMAYVRGSANELHPYANYRQNQIDLDYCASYLAAIEIVKTTGRAGDMFFFDSNGAHRAVRSLGAQRDALFVEYSAERNLDNYWGTEMDRRRVPASYTAPDHPLARFFAVEPKWRRVRHEAPRKLPEWAHTLPDPQAWL